MKTLMAAALALILVFTIVQLCGCVPGLTSTKQSAEPTKTLKAEDSPPVGREFDTGDAKAADKEAGRKVAGKAPDASKAPKKPGIGGQEPEYNPPPPPQKSTVAAINPAEKEEINRAALEFSKNVQNVMHVQTRYSRLYGWHMYLYVKQKGKIIPHQYSWNPKNKEWEFLYALKEVPGDQLKSYLNTKLGDEQSFLLK